jgi:CelD/BcsL family acetyltransferase involved in cellulose biosynthesis
VAKDGLQGLSVHTLTSVEELAGLSEDYERLRSLAGVKLPFALHEWHVAWCMHLMSHDVRVCDTLHVWVVRDASGMCVAIVPMVKTRRLVGPFSVVSLELLGVDYGLTEIRTMLIAPGYEEEVAGVLQQQLRTMDRWDWVQWVGCEPRFWAALSSRLPLKPREPTVDYMLDLPGTWEELRSTRKRNIRESLRHCYNSLKRDNIEFSFVVVTEREAIADALEVFFRLHAMRAERQDTVMHRNGFEGAAERRFLHEVCGRLAAHGRVRIFQLVIGGQVVATRIGFVVDDSLYLYYSGYDPAWSKYSVMTTTVAEILKYAISRGLRSANLSIGKDESKLRWGPREVQIPRAVQVNPALRSQAAFSGYTRLREENVVSGWVGSVLRSKRTRG